MFLKYFCLPSNSNISSLENRISKINLYLCRNYNHTLCVLQGKQKCFKKGKYFFNRMGDIDENDDGVYANHNAINLNLRREKRNR